VEALRQGIDAPRSTAEIQVDPAELPVAEREALADRMASDGYKTSIVLLAPTLERLRSYLQARVAEDRSAKEKAVASAERAVKEAIASVGQGTDEVWIACDRDGKVTSLVTGSFASIKIQAPRGLRWVAPSDLELVSPDLQGQYEAAQALARAAYDAAVIDALPALMMRRDELLALEQQAAEEKVRQEREYEALYARLPEALRARDADGYALEDEIERAIAKIMRADAYPPDTALFRPDLEHRQDAEVLTDEQHARFVEVRAHAPEGATVEAREGWHAYDPCDDHEEFEESCRACQEVKQTTIDARWARVSWQRGGVKAVALFEL